MRQRSVTTVYTITEIVTYCRTHQDLILGTDYNPEFWPIVQAIGNHKRLEVLRLLGPPDEQRGLNGLNLPTLKTLQLFRCVQCYDEKPDPSSDGLIGALPLAITG